MNHLLRTPRLHVGAGTTHGALTVFPLWVEAPSVHGLHWSGQQLSVSELAGGPSVGQLAVRNRSSGPAVLLEGDLVEGGWQNRMIATSVLLAGGASYDLPARCVEQGRWNGTKDQLLTCCRVAYSVSAARRDGADLVDQGDVWRRIDRFEQRFGRTASASLFDHLRRQPAPVIPVLEGQRGVVIGIGGRVVAAEVFGRSRGLRTRWDGIIAAAWLDAVQAPAVATPAKGARDFVRRLGSVGLTGTGSAGIGRRLTARHPTLHVQGLGTTSSQIVHVAAIDPTHPYVLAA